MPYHDLNLIYTPKHTDLTHTLSFHAELGYTVVALSIQVTGKIPSTPETIPISQLSVPQSLTLLTRLTLTIADTTQNHRISSLQTQYDLIALRPTSEKALQICCSSLECDLISLDFSQRLPFVLRFKTIASALQRGIRFEICYGPGILGGSDSKRNLISGATALIRATRGRGIVVSSEARNALGLRAPNDLINLCLVWGLGQERGKEAVCDEPARVVRLARMRRTSYRGVVDVVGVEIEGDGEVDGQVHRNEDESGTKVLERGRVIDNDDVMAESGMESGTGTKRKASSAPMQPTQSNETEKPLSKREQKRRAKKARIENNLNGDQTTGKPNAFPIRHETLIQKS